VTTTIRHGTPVWVRDVTGDLLPRVAVSGVVRGMRLPRGGFMRVVWAVTEETWRLPDSAHCAPLARPWPAEDVTPREPSPNRCTQETP
jgi:hypothetical protein